MPRGRSESRQLAILAIVYLQDIKHNPLNLSKDIMSAEEKEVEATVIKSGPSVLRREVPDEVIQPITSDEYKELRLMTDMREPFR